MSDQHRSKEHNENKATWGNHCLCEWCCDDFNENMFCICVRNYDDMLEPCSHDTRLFQYPPAPVNNIDLTKVKTKELIKFYNRLLSEIESRGVTW